MMLLQTARKNSAQKTEKGRQNEDGEKREEDEEDDVREKDLRFSRTG